MSVFVAIDGMLLFQDSGAVFNQLGTLYEVSVSTSSEIPDSGRGRCGARDSDAGLRRCDSGPDHGYEVATGHNPYAIFGGARVAEYASLAVRDNKIRAQGPFAHSILAGTFGAVLVPLFVGLWWKSKKYGKIALVAFSRQR